MEAGHILELPLDENESIRMAWCPPGEFVMGYRADDVYAPPISKFSPPQIRVKLTKGFWLGVTPITQSQLHKIMGYYAGLYLGEKFDSRFPICCQTWNRAVSFCQRLTAFWQAKGAINPAQEVTVPTEAQWEYACRAGTTSHWYFGDDVADLEKHAWVQSNSNNRRKPVGQKLPNPWGLYDLYGNVPEWTLDDFYIFNESSEPITDPVHVATAPTYQQKILKGGDYWISGSHTGSSERKQMAVHNPFNDYVGIRILLTS